MTLWRNHIPGQDETPEGDRPRPSQEEAQPRAYSGHKTVTEWTSAEMLLRMQRLGRGGRLPPMESRHRTMRRRWFLAWILVVTALVAGFFVWKLGLFRKAAPPAPPPLPAAVQKVLNRALQGDPGSMALLGTMYCNGVEVPKDVDEGRRWLLKAAEAGHAGAREQLWQMEMGSGR